MHHDKNMTYEKFPIIVFRVGTAGDVNIPVVLLASVKSIHKRFIGDFLSDNFGLPEASRVVLNKNSYADDVTW